MKKRTTSRGIIIEDDSVYLLYRRKKSKDGTIKEYYAIPGGGVEKGETNEEAVLRELNEELSIKAKILGYLGYIDEATNSFFYHCEKTDGEYKLGGEELEHNNPDNYYEIRKIQLNELENIKLFKYNLDLIIKAKNKIYQEK